MDVDEGNVNLVSEAVNARGVMRIYIGVQCTFHAIIVDTRITYEIEGRRAAEKYWRTVTFWRTKTTKTGNCFLDDMHRQDWISR